MPVFVEMPVYAGVEGGGQSFVAAIASGSPLRIRERAEFPTKSVPSETLNEVAAWLSTRSYDALGVACFGPVDLDPASKTWGHITSTPKAGWQNTDVLGALVKVRKVPCAFDTDVNAPAVSEYRSRKVAGEDSCAYVTVGTGIGVGLVVNGRSVKGLLHPEGGHIAVLRRPTDTYQGCDGPHPWSLEGQCSAPAIAERAGVPLAGLKDLPDDHPVWADVAQMLGSLCATLVCVASPQRIVLSGGVMKRTSLFHSIRKATREILNGYIQHPRILEDGPEGIDGFIVASAHGNDAGIFGALSLAVDALEDAAPVPQKPKRQNSLSQVLDQKISNARFADALGVAALCTAVLVGVVLRRRGERL